MVWQYDLLVVFLECLQMQVSQHASHYSDVHSNTHSPGADETNRGNHARDNLHETDTSEPTSSGNEGEIDPKDNEPCS